MGSGKWYPPAPTVHEVTCDGAPPGLLIVKARTLHGGHFRAHDCVSRNTVLYNRDCVLEPAFDEPHSYERSTVWPEDATGPLCQVCGGTHAESETAARAHRRIDPATGRVGEQPR